MNLIMTSLYVIDALIMLFFGSYFLFVGKADVSDTVHTIISTVFCVYVLLKLFLYPRMRKQHKKREV